MTNSGKKKLLVLLPDGVGLRNFLFSKFTELKTNDVGFVFWDSVGFEPSLFPVEVTKGPEPKLHPLTDIYKNTRKHVELDLFVSRFKDPVYHSYRFPFRSKSIKDRFKTTLTRFFISRFSSEDGLTVLRDKIRKTETKTAYYRSCLAEMERIRPDVVFCTNQRQSIAIAPILAAKELGIPTATFIFSWDNLPKAMMVVECDYYYVWSDFMKEQLLQYYTYISESQVVVCGTPQFEMHFAQDTSLTRDAFFQMHGLDLKKKYVCFSGDDVTTSPDDAFYLRDTAEAIRRLNNQGNNLGILFRRCPVDFTARFDEVLREFSDIIVSVDPLWTGSESSWHSAIPTKADGALLANTAAHTIGAINIGSSMVFDFAIHGKPCAYVRYDQPHREDGSWSVKKIYNYVHFRSMPEDDAVFWIRSKDQIDQVLREMLGDSSKVVQNATLWFDKIASSPKNEASERIVESLLAIASQ